MRKFLTFIVVSLMAASILSSCKKDENGTTPSGKYPVTLDGTYANVDASTGSTTILYVQTLAGVTYASFMDGDKESTVKSADGEFVYNSNNGVGQIKNDVKGGLVVSVQAEEGTTISNVVYATVGSASPSSEPYTVTLLRAGGKKMKEGYWEYHNDSGDNAYMEIAQDSKTKVFSGIIRQMRSFNAAVVRHVSDFVEVGSEYVGIMSLGFDDSVAVVMSKYNYDNNDVTLVESSSDKTFSGYKSLRNAPSYNPTDIQGFTGVWKASNASAKDLQADVFIFYNLGGVYAYVVHKEEYKSGDYSFVTAAEGALEYEPDYGLGTISVTTQGSSIGKIWAERFSNTPAFDLSVESATPEKTDGKYYCVKNDAADLDTLPTGEWKGDYIPSVGGDTLFVTLSLTNLLGKVDGEMRFENKNSAVVKRIHIDPSVFVTLNKGGYYGVFSGTDLTPGSGEKYNWIVKSLGNDEGKKAFILDVMIPGYTIRLTSNSSLTDSYNANQGEMAVVDSVGCGSTEDWDLAL